MSPHTSTSTLPPTAALIQRRLVPGTALPPPEALHTLAALALNAGTFSAAALCLHRLGLRVLGGGARGARLADLSLLLFCANPASVFYSAPYTEALFAACTWAGLLLLPRAHWAGVAALAAAAAARSNGILGVWFPLHKLLAAWRHAPQGRLPWREVARTAASCAAILAPYAAMQGGHVLGWAGLWAGCLLAANTTSSHPKLAAPPSYLPCCSPSVRQVLHWRRRRCWRTPRVVRRRPTLGVWLDPARLLGRRPAALLSRPCAGASSRAWGLVAEPLAGPGFVGGQGGGQVGSRPLVACSPCSLGRPWQL